MPREAQGFERKVQGITATTATATGTTGASASSRFSTPDRKKRHWIQRLQSVASKEESVMSSGANTTNYESMPDIMESHTPPRPSSKRSLRKQDSTSNNSTLLLDDAGAEQEDEVYLVRQSYGVFSILFSLAQTVILIIMMVQCGVAPMNINPMLGPYPDALSEWGGKNAVNILDDNEWWRLLTPILLHAGVIHLLCNIAVQLETGAFFEREWGSVNWLIVFLSSAIGSSVLSVICMPNSISVGSSGAVMGLFGGKLAEVFCRACESTKTPQARVGHAVRKEQLSGTLCAVTIVMAFSFIPYVDWAAHLGGLVAGFVVGLPVFSCWIKTMVWRFWWFIVGAALAVTTFTLALTYMYSGVIDPADELRDVCGYYQQFFDDYECKCMRDGGQN